MIKGRKGFTLIELIVVMAITGIVLTAISSFLISNVKLFGYGDDQIECQYQAQLLMNKLVDCALENGGIKDEHGNMVTHLYARAADGTDVSGTTSSNELEIEMSSGRFRFVDTDYKVTLNGADFARFIAGFQIKSADGSVLKDCKAIDIMVKSEKNKASITLTNRVYFRNIP